MITDYGRRFVINRLTAARNLTELAAVWGTIATAYQSDPTIHETKERLKAQMQDNT